MPRHPWPFLCVLAISRLAAAQDDEPPAVDPVYGMQYGPFLSGTIQAPWPADNVTLKGLALTLPGGGAVLFDTELLRLSAAWTGEFLKLVGTPYDGAHGTIPSVGGRMVAGTKAAPGWARPGGGGTEFADPRPIPHGPLPRDHGRYQGLWLSGRRVVLGYTVGGCEVREGFALEAIEGRGAIARTLELAASKQPLTLVLCEREGAEAVAEGRLAFLKRAPDRPQLVTAAVTQGEFDELPVGWPVSTDHADKAAGHGVTMHWVEGFSVPHARAGAGEDKSLPRLHDGKGVESDDDTDANVWFDGGDARILVDLKSKVAVQRVRTFSCHRAERAPQRYTLYGSSADSAPDQKAEAPEPAGWTKVSSVDTRKLKGPRHGVAIARPEGTPLGEFRWLLLHLDRVGGNGTFFSEIDVFTADQDAGGPPPLPTVPMLTGVGLVDAPAGCVVTPRAGRLELTIPAHDQTIRVKLLYWDGPEAVRPELDLLVGVSPKAEDLSRLTRGGPSRWPRTVTTKGTLGKDDGAWTVDTLTVPERNPYHSRLRFGAFDFFADGRAAIATWNGDVWIVSGIDDKLEKLTWKRFATGLFDPLGLRIVDGVVHTLGRDQITRLHDLNGDGEADRYECFNNEVLITKNFHEFAFDLQTDPEGNFYFSKGGPVKPGGRGFDKIVPHHGTVLKVSKDGQKLEVFATGFRAPNGIGVGPSGEVTSGDNEGTWMPRCRLNWIRPGSFNGCVDLAHRPEKPTTYDPPLCFLPMPVDNSSGGQVWVTTSNWGPLQGELLHLSYGQCSLYHVLKEEVDGVVQGGVVRIPVNFQSSCMRARFFPKDGNALYIAGFKGWQTRAARDTAFQRVRYTGKPARLPKTLHVRQGEIEIGFTDPLDKQSAEDVKNWTLERWNYLWTDRYGSPEISLVKPPPDFSKKGVDYNDFKEHDPVPVRSARLSGDGRTVVLAIEGLVPVMQMKIAMNLATQDGGRIKTEIHHTIHKLGPDIAR